MDKSPVAIGVDVGGTKIAAGVVDAAGRLLARTRRDSPNDRAALFEAIVAAVGDLGPDVADLPIGVGAAGFVDADRSTVLFAPNLPWRAEPLGAALAERLGRAVVVENDANAATWAEAKFGAGIGHRHVACVTVGTGVGGGLVIDGALVRGGYGVAAEFGHIPLVPDGVACGCGQHGCWEQYAGGHALERYGRDLVRAGGPAAAALSAACGGVAEHLVGPMITALARDGDAAAVGLFAELGHWLGVGLVALAAVLDPTCFVIGGGVGEAGDLLLAPARESFARRLPAGANRPVAAVIPARLGNDAGMIGAGDLARLEGAR
ncbi:MAG TPA: ROK family glucokinase [Sporichthyaceae bacterium]